MTDAVVALPATSPPPAMHSGAILSEAALGTMLGALASRQGPVPKYRYPSAGTLYPVQAYLVLRRGLGGLAAGSYYHDPDAHALVPLSESTPAAPDGSIPDALLLLVAQYAAIEPIYGAQTASFCLLEAGYMAEALRAAPSGLSLRIAGDPSGDAALAAACALESEHRLLICWAVGENG